MEDLFRSTAPKRKAREEGEQGRRERRKEQRFHRERDDEQSDYGGHNLRPVIVARAHDEGTSGVTYRPRSALASSKARQVLECAMEDDDSADGDNNPPSVDIGDAARERNRLLDGDDVNSEDEDDLDESNDDDDDESGLGTPSKTIDTQPDPNPPHVTAPPPHHGSGATAPPLLHIPFTNVRDGSALGKEAAVAYHTGGFSMQREVGWQASVAGDATKAKSFRQEVTQQVDVTAFGYMRVSSPFIQIIHSISTYAARGGDSDLQNKDFGMVGDRTDLRIPTAVVVEDKMWKWVQKKLDMDSGPLEVFYSNPGNAKLLYYADAQGANSVRVPSMIYLPPPLLVYCTEAQRTPFDLHQFIIRYATRPDSELPVDAYTMLREWCIVAAHCVAPTAPTTSMMSTVLPTAPSDDDDFLRWLYKIDGTRPDTNRVLSAPRAGAKGMAMNLQNNTVPTNTAPSPAGLHMPSAAAGPPGPDIWAQMAKNISSSLSTSFASAAAAFKPPVDPGDVSENGGVLYDKFQMAIVQGFAHVPDITGVPSLWAQFQYTKNIAMHKENLKRKMRAWATAKDRKPHVPIDNGLYIPDATMREIITLNFNPGGVLAEADTADLGLSMLICRARTTAAKTAVRRYEKAREQSRRNLSMAEAQREEATPGYDTGSLPDDYNELKLCLGTYCALLYALFGKHCTFYRHCYEIWTTMNSDLVQEQRSTMFDVLFCRQIVWAIIAESRCYFAQRLTTDDFAVAHPEDIEYPTSRLLGIVNNVREGTPIIRSSFPASWRPGGAPTTSGGAIRSGSSTQGTTTRPVQSIAASTDAPTVVSGITTGSATRAQQQPPATIRTHNVHPLIKTALEACIAKNKGVYVGAMLTHCNLTLDDLPKLPDVTGSNGICYNFVLGRCNMNGCQHEHVNVRDVTDDFATELLTKLRPAITEFTANGLPPGYRRRRRPRRRREE